ncbi:MAG TPA: transposase [Thermodesulfobacteriota bacterium]|nr:transposase [Thermodesulfobacteriota bacterium]
MIQRATIEDYAQAVRIVKEMDIDYHQWKENDWKEEGRKAVKQVIEYRRNNYLDMRLVEISNQGIYDRKNGYYSRHLLTGLGDIEFFVPRTRTTSAGAIKKLVPECFYRGKENNKAYGCVQQ